VIEQGFTDASASTIWRWLHDRSLKPWQQRSWIFPRDPDFQAKAGRVLDLYERRFDGRLLHPGEFVICADEKSQLQALARRHQTVAAAPGRPASTRSPPASAPSSSTTARSRNRLNGPSRAPSSTRSWPVSPAARRTCA
jgi:hypothetical protein